MSIDVKRPLIMGLPPGPVEKIYKLSEIPIKSLFLCTCFDLRPYGINAWCSTLELYRLGICWITEPGQKRWAIQVEVPLYDTDPKKKVINWDGFKNNFISACLDLKNQMEFLNKKYTNMSDFKQYKRKETAELRPVTDYDIEVYKGHAKKLIVMNGSRVVEVSVSEADRNNGSQKIGDMVARNPKNYDDQWLVAQKYFGDNFEEL